MPKQNILVTGANGFIGRALMDGLDRGRFNVFALDNARISSTKIQSLKKFFLQDITQPFNIQEHFDCVFHLAALNVTHVDKAAYDAYHRVNVLGTENLIKAVKARHFVFMSTVKVYREQEGVIDEESILGPQSDYARSKLEAEHVCQKHIAGEALTILRPVNIAGYGQAEKAVIPVFFKKALAGEPLDIIYSSQTQLQLLHIEDVLGAFDLLSKKDRGIAIVNLCPEDTISLGELAERIRALCKSGSGIRCSKDTEVITPKYVSRRVQAVLGWRAQRSVQDILENYYESAAVHP